MTNLKKADKYVTFIPQNQEFSLIGYQEGMGIITTNPIFLKFGFEEVHNYVGKKYLRFLINSEEKLKLFTNAYDLRYKALYQGEEFSAGVSSYPQIILFAGTFDYGASATTTIKGFEIEAGNWVKKVDISEVTLIPIRTPIDLSQYLPS